jgi:predicted DNA binding CopG/RHH family protein
MSKLQSSLPKKMAKNLLIETHEWDKAIANESPEQAEVFRVSRPPRQPVSLRLDPFDLSMVKRIARKKGIPHTQLIALWLHERIEREKRT